MASLGYKYIYRPRKTLIGTVSQSNCPQSIDHAAAILYGKTSKMEYCKSLSGAELRRYLDKLKILQENSAESCLDPFEIAYERRLDDVSHWPPVEFSQIYAYLADTPGQFTRKKDEGL